MIIHLDQKFIVLYLILRKQFDDDKVTLNKIKMKFIYKNTILRFNLRTQKYIFFINLNQIIQRIKYIGLNTNIEKYNGG